MIELRSVSEKDWDFILKIRNEQEFRSNFYNQDEISKEEHYEYLRSSSNDPNFFNWIICDNSKDVGYIRIFNEDISIMVSPYFHGKGIGTKALELVETEAKKNGIKKLVGRVKISNESSKKIFEQNGYDLLMYWYEKDIA